MEIQNLQKWINECDKNPCQNHGKCTDLPDGYKCTCLHGTTGTNCETDIDACLENPCVHGTCLDEINNYTCNCESGYYGQNCDTNIPPCPKDNSDYLLINDHCLYLEKSRRTYVDANQNCKSQFNGNGKLFEPNTWIENENVYKVVKSIYSYWWIGVNDVQSEGNYVYESSGQPITFTPKWRPGYGVRNTGQNCIFYHTPISGSSEVLEWVDFPCTSNSKIPVKYYSICERIV